MKKRLVVVGGHGSGEIAMSVFEEVNKVKEEWILEGFLTDIVEPGGLLGRHKVLGGTAETADYVRRGYYVHYTLHFNAQAKAERVALLRSLGIPREAHATAVHPRAYLEPSTVLGHGVLVCAHAATSFGPVIGDCVHIYANGFVGHDAHIGDFATVTAHAVVGGRVRVEEGAHLGLNSVTREDIRIGRYAIVGMGAVVTRDVDDYTIVGGNPAHVLRSLTPQSAAPKPGS
ncbi:MAG: hypothetical protein JXA57_10005 [Armatimonadetes bacterium]|nr:hypothetical protein [Armatimonadota bacterium]